MAEDVGHMLTTIDNPWSPFENYDEWYAWDRDAGYNTPGLLARVAVVSVDSSDTDFENGIEEAMQEIAEQNVSGMHRLVSRSDRIAA